MKRLLSPLLVAALALAISASALGAATYSTTLGIGRSGANFSGRVRSPTPVCVPARRVVVYRQRTGPDPSMGATASDANGSWRVHVAGHLPAGNYYARTPAARRGGGTCATARSVTTHSS